MLSTDTLKTAVITTDEFHLIQRMRKLEEKGLDQVSAFITGLLANPWSAAVRQNRKNHPEHFLINATIEEELK